MPPAASGSRVARPLDEGPQRQGLGKVADPAQRLVLGEGERHGVAEAARLREGLAHALGRDVRVGVRHVERDVADDEVGDGGSLRAGRGDAVHAAQQERVVHEQQVGAERRGPPR